MFTLGTRLWSRVNVLPGGFSAKDIIHFLQLWSLPICHLARHVAHVGAGVAGEAAISPLRSRRRGAALQPPARRSRPVSQLAGLSPCCVEAALCVVPIPVVKDQRKRKNAGGLQGAEPLGTLELGVRMVAGAGAGAGDRSGLQAESLDLVLQLTEGSVSGT